MTMLWYSVVTIGVRKWFPFGRVHSYQMHIDSLASIGKAGLQFQSSFRYTDTTIQHPLRQKERLQRLCTILKKNIDKNPFCMFNIGGTTEWSLDLLKITYLTIS